MTSGLILYGGSFDPVHRGHLEMAAFAMRHLNASQLVFIPASRSPLKCHAPAATGPQRIAMLRLAIEGQEQYQVSDCELNRTQPSYTYDTVCHWRSRLNPTVPLYCLAGADVIAELDQWYRIGDLLELCRICVMYRAGFAAPSFEGLKGKLSAGQIAQLTEDMLPTPLVDISSTQIRRNIALGRDVSGMLLPVVWEFVKKNGLYGCRNPQGG